MTEKNICILGQGRSFKRVKEFADKIDEIILCNYDQNFINQNILNDPELLKILQDKKCILFCNTSKTGFNQMAFDNFNVARCVVNRVRPTDNWELWRLHKSTQKKGIWYHDENIPPFEKDLPYFYKWRGPAPVAGVHPNNVNYPQMSLQNGFNIEHLSENIEMYLFEPTRDRLETNMGLYFTALYAIIDLKKDNLYYAGIDFYDTQGDGEAWKAATSDRLKMEGGHMKILADKYLSKYFPQVTFNFYTEANFEPDSKNIKVIEGKT